MHIHNTKLQLPHFLLISEKQNKSGGESSVPTVEPRPSQDGDDSSDGGKIVFKKPTKKRKSSEGG